MFLEGYMHRFFSPSLLSHKCCVEKHSQLRMTFCRSSAGETRCL